MTEEQINATIAKLMGWTGIFYVEETDAWVGNKPGGGKFRFPLPKYTSSIDACAEFESALTDIQFRGYWDVLSLITEQAEEVKSYRAFLSATAPQRCEAYLRTIGKWEASA